MISGVRTNPHGKEFKEWASKCTKAFSHLNVRVTTKHTYAIAYKYIWQCTSCRVEFKRHSKSIDPVRHACGVCKAKLEQIKPLPRKTAPSQYQLFVKERYKSVQDANPTSPRKDIMGLVAKEYKASRANVGAKDDDIIASRPASKDDADMLHDVMRKLDFVNLLDDWMN
ncbi:MAG: hypothetical protein M1814_006518 [Vezdaea aestivalis]|nr:MAG: hypothetical protein M1814_006518 [Vezdaea aestivalis]